jgi:CheY-like chemotaxis protein
MVKQKILIVEDDADLRRLYALGLNRRGYDVKLASNGLEAIDRIQAERPDLILLDIAMPVMSGWEMLDRVNPPESSTAIPVIVVTGQSAPEGGAGRSCIADWVVKPVSISELVQVIATRLP